MSAGKFNVSYSAIAQLALLPAAEKAELTHLFSGTALNQLETTRATPAMVGSSLASAASACCGIARLFRSRRFCPSSTSRSLEPE